MIAYVMMKEKYSVKKALDTVRKSRFVKLDSILNFEESKIEKLINI